MSMKIVPKVKGFICTTAHPEGCKENVKQQIRFVKERGAGEKSMGNVLVIGCSTGYGLASRITAAFGGGAGTLGIMFEKEPTQTRTATPGYYNTRAFEELARAEGHYAETINGDAFSREVKQQAVEMISRDLGKIDLVIYSLAAPKRIMEDGTVYSSVLKTKDQVFTNKSWDLKDNSIKEASIEPASEEEVQATIKVMGGEDWLDWMNCLSDADVLNENATTVAYSYIGPDFTNPIYRDGTIGMAKKHLEESAAAIRSKYAGRGIRAFVSVNKALVTQASAAIPIVPLYFAVLYKVMKEKGIHEGCIEQIQRLFSDKLTSTSAETDENGLIRMDDLEMRQDVQEAVKEIWNRLATGNVEELADVSGYWEDFYHLFGFGFEQVDYEKEVEIL